MRFTLEQEILLDQIRIEEIHSDGSRPFIASRNKKKPHWRLRRLARRFAPCSRLLFVSNLISRRPNRDFTLAFGELASLVVSIDQLLNLKRTSASKPKCVQALPNSSHTLIRNTSEEVRGGCAVSLFCPVHQRQRFGANQATSERSRVVIVHRCPHRASGHRPSASFDFYLRTGLRTLSEYRLPFPSPNGLPVASLPRRSGLMSCRLKLYRGFRSNVFSQQQYPESGKEQKKWSFSKLFCILLVSGLGELTMLRFLVITVATLLPMSVAYAQQPIFKNGSCPSGYYSSGNYCVPSSSGSQPAIDKNGSCPTGYYSSGNYCVMTSSGKPAIPKSGSCPSGYYSSGNYCVQSR